MSRKDILEVKNLKSGYDSFFIEEINFDVKKGDFIGIIGPNGSGKTTLIRALTGTIKPLQGEILHEGKDIRHMSYRDLARRVAVVSQNPGVGFLTVEDFVMLGRIPHYGKFQFFETSEDQKIADKCMGLTGISRFKDQFVEETSGGERQLAFIARALCQEPALLLLDEPTTYLDITNQVEIMDLLKRLNHESGLTVIMVLHDLNLASEYCSQLILMNRGRIHSTGTPDEVLTYRIIEEVYKTVVVVEKNPISLRPYVILVSEETRLRSQDK